MRVLTKFIYKFAPSAPKDQKELVDILGELGFEAEAVDKDVLEISITPNRGDAMSAFGLARDLLSWLKYKQNANSFIPLPDSKYFNNLLKEKIPLVENKARNAVTGYHGVVFENVRIQPSPIWLQIALKKMGCRPINNFVDLTNYLMEIYGQPLHAFDLDSILGEQLIIRLAKDGEKITTLDGIDRNLDSSNLIIQDRESIIDLAGIMGGSLSEITAKTTRVFLQAACFSPESIRRSTNTINHQTQAAMRYERGVDPNLAIPVLSEAIKFLKKIEFGQARAVSSLSIKSLSAKTEKIKYSIKKTNKFLGLNLKSDLHNQILSSLGCDIKGTENLIITPPSWRYDLKIWQDAAEEIARFTGLNESFPPKPLRAESSRSVKEEKWSTVEWIEGLKDQLIKLGLNEILTYSFTGRKLLKIFELPITGELANPLNPELKFLLPSLVPNLVQAASANQSFDPILLFEIGHVFTKKNEEIRLGIVLVGNIDSANVWLARLADVIGMDSETLKQVALITELTDYQRQQLKLRKSRATVIEFKLDDLISARKISKAYQVSEAVANYKRVSRFPAVSRDLALVVSIDIKSEDIEEMIRSFDQLVESVELFDEFESVEKFGLNQKSLAYHIYYANPDHTLTESEANALHENLTLALERTFNAKRR